MPQTTDVTMILPLVDELLMLIHETAEYQAHPAARAVLGEARRVVLNIRRRLHGGQHRYVVALVGLTNVGKSTLTNALLGEDLAPRRNGPCTAAPIEFMHGPEPRLTVLYHEQLHRPSWNCPRVEDIHRRLQELATDGGSDAGITIRKILVQVPHPLLASGIVIADTPGFGAAQAGVAAGSHEEALRGYLHAEVAQVFWVVLAEQGIGRREQQFHRQFLAEVCDDVLVTGSEDWDERDRARFRQRFAHELGQRLPRFHFVSGLQGLRARRAGDPAGLERAGVTALESRLAELADPAGRQAAQIANLLQLAGDLADWRREFRDERQRPPRRFWRPDSWTRWAVFLPEDGLKRQLIERLGDEP